MRILRSKDRGAEPVTLPEVSESVTVAVRGAGWIPARVLERGPDALVVAITVRTRKLTAEQLETLKIEFSSPRGRVRLRGTVATQDPASPEVITLSAPRSVEVLQEREYVRIKSARPVLVFSAREGMQIQSFTVDVSGGGLLLAGPDTLAVGDQIDFQLTLTPGVTPVSGTGRVVRVDGQGRRAVEFESISELDRRRLVRFIFECQRTERRRGLDGEGRG
jgi:c-di-GMP-binding flagellar brake protein YcgR